MKRPAFQFYPADWRKDSALQSCGMAARGLWHEMMCIMHECFPYGHLAVNGQAMSSGQLARLVGESERSVRNWLVELKAAGVYSETQEGVIYSRRMVKDERIRNVRAESGRLGGNPVLLGDKVKQVDNLASNLEPTPSSSSSSSSSSQGHLPAPNGARHAISDASPVVIALPLRDGSDFEVRQSLVAELEPLYPAVDVPQTLREMRGWLLGNPERRKKRSGARRFVTNWLQSEQEKHGG